MAHVAMSQMFSCMFQETANVREAREPSTRLKESKIQGREKLKPFWLIVYQWSVVHLQFSNIFSETCWPINPKFNAEHPWEGGTKVYINGPGQMTKMAAMRIYGNNLLQNRKFMILKLGMHHRGSSSTMFL